MNSRSLPEERLHPCSSCGEMSGTGPWVEQSASLSASGLDRRNLEDKPQWGGKKMTRDSMCNDERESTWSFSQNYPTHFLCCVRATGDEWNLKEWRVGQSRSRCNVELYHKNKIKCPDLNVFEHLLWRNPTFFWIYIYFLLHCQDILYSSIFILFFIKWRGKFQQFSVCEISGGGGISFQNYSALVPQSQAWTSNFGIKAELGHNKAGFEFEPEPRYKFHHGCADPLQSTSTFHLSILDSFHNGNRILTFLDNFYFLWRIAVVCSAKSSWGYFCGIFCRGEHI